MDDERRVPMRMGEFSVLDTEFNSIKERFDNEMKRMEDEMNRFRGELMNRESSIFRKSGSSSQSGEPDLVPGVQGRLGGHSAWLQNIDSPLLKEKDKSEAGEKELKLRFDVSQYSPEEIIVKTIDNKLLVQAKHEENKDGRSIYREYNREFLLPQGTDPEQIKSSLSKDGILTVEAPLPVPALTHN
eukprot:TRINITY_DN21277_c0_g1_i1.p1 TRINITY_DN21277_c0_g1~~TRINITY_DN21277_c0_g1_i1.p1  ORF type:complete len:195 (+),score=41.35 TRINITY_DN21277_c0_g1_i1:28-585(+)